MSRYTEENNSVLVEELKGLATDELPSSKLVNSSKPSNQVPWKSNKAKRNDEQQRHRITCNCTFCVHEQPCNCLHCINNPCNCVECMIARGPFSGKGSSKENQKTIKIEH